MDPKDPCKVFQDCLRSFRAWTDTGLFDAHAPPFNDEKSREAFGIAQEMQWEHLKECDRCRNFMSHREDCDTYEVAMWMKRYALHIFATDQKLFCSGQDPIVPRILRAQMELNLDDWLIAHARACERHHDEYADLIAVGRSNDPGKTDLEN